MTDDNEPPKPKILDEGDSKPIAETISDIEMEMETEQEFEQASQTEATPDIDQDVLAGGIGAAVCGLADAVCEKQGVSTLNAGENKALSGAIANLVPHFAPAKMNAKQVAVMTIVLVTIGIATPRLAELKQKKTPPAKPQSENIAPVGLGDGDE